MRTETVSDGTTEKEYHRNKNGLLIVPYSHVVTVIKLEALWKKIDREEKSVILVAVKGGQVKKELAKLWRLSAVGAVDGLGERSCASIENLAPFLAEKASQAFLIVNGRAAQQNNITQRVVRTSWKSGQVMRGVQGRVKPIGSGEALAGCPPLAVLSTLDWKPPV